MKFLKEANFLAAGISAFLAATFHLETANALGSKIAASNPQTELVTWSLVIIAASQLFYGLFFGLRLIYLGLSEAEHEETRGNYWDDSNETTFVARAAAEESPIFVSPFKILSYERGQDLSDES